MNLAAEIRNLEAAFPMQSATTLLASVASHFMELPGMGAQMHVFIGDRDYLLVSVLGLGEGEAILPR